MPCLQKKMMKGYPFIMGIYPHDDSSVCAPTETEVAPLSFLYYITVCCLSQHGLPLGTGHDPLYGKEDAPH